MSSLFRIETDLFILTWSAPRRPTPRVGFGVHPVVSFSILEHRPGAKLDVWIDPQFGDAPFLFEQTDYKVMVRSKCAQPIGFEQRDPGLSAELEAEDEGRLWFGVVNYGAQVGRSVWRIWVGSTLEVAFEVEVFPSKLSYRADYDAIMHDVQSILTGLALTYLRATTQKGAPKLSGNTSDVEWVTLLRLVCDELEQALAYVVHHPKHALHATQVPRQSQRVQLRDRSARMALARGRGHGDLGHVGDFVVRQRVPVLVSEPTLDTPAHRWIGTSLAQFCAKLRQLIVREQARVRHPSSRSQTTVDELVRLTARLDRWRLNGPWANLPPMDKPFGHSMRHPGVGYSEVFRLLRLMSNGLVVRDGPLDLNVKDLSQLYEYWCYLIFVQLLQEITGAEIDVTSLFSIKHDGLSVLLAHGVPSNIVVHLEGGDRCVLAYNPTFKNDALYGQRPDMVLSFEREGWPALHLVFDAKYRIDPKGEVGPPVDAINALHRYRDAILVSHEGALMHQVVQAVALFPYEEPVHERGSYEENRLWQSLASYGVGAIPLLPGETSYARRWLTRMLHRHGWGLAEDAVSHVAVEALHTKQMHANEVALVGVLRTNWSEHMDWIEQTQSYYMPHYASQPKQMQAQWVAFYLPAHDGMPGQISHVARVMACEVVPRAHVETPWHASRPDVRVVVYLLGPLSALKTPILNVHTRNDNAQRFSHSRWTTALALTNAQHVAQLRLESSWAWSMYSALIGLDEDACVESFEGVDGGFWIVGVSWKVWRIRGDYRLEVEGEGYEAQTLDDVLALWNELIV